MVLSDKRETVTLEEIKSSIFADPQRMNLQEKLQGMVSKEANTIREQTWICVPVTVPTLNSRHVGIARLKSNVNLGPHAEEIRFFILVLCPSDVKVTKTSLETARTFGTLFSDLSLRHNLMTSNTVTEFKAHILVTSNEFANHQALKNGNIANNDDVKEEEEIKWFQVGKGLKMDFMRRIPYYLDDYKDGLIGPTGTVQKTVATTFFLYFSVILPAVALGVLNSYNTHGEISVYQVIVGQTFGALIFAIFSGQPLVVVMTTAPLALIIKTIYSIAGDFGVPFLPFYAAIGLWNTFFLFLYSVFNMSVLMKFSSRSTEEIFFQLHYHCFHQGFNNKHG
jgi:sodium borate transporter 11